MRRTAGIPPRLFPALPLMLLAALAADGTGTPSIMALMHKQFTVARAPFKTIRRELDARSPDWEKVRQAAARSVALAADLAKTTPRRGSPESWRHLIDRHSADAGAMADAAEARDLDALRAAYRRIAASCTTCHDAHRFRRGD